MQYHRSGSCSKGASCERLHGIYCKVSLQKCFIIETYDKKKDHYVTYTTQQANKATCKLQRKHQQVLQTASSAKNLG